MRKGHDDSGGFDKGGAWLYRWAAVMHAGDADGKLGLLVIISCFRISSVIAQKSSLTKCRSDASDAKCDKLYFSLSSKYTIHDISTKPMR